MKMMKTKKKKKKKLHHIVFFWSNLYTQVSHCTLQKRFQHDEDVYKSFVEIFNMYRNHDKRITEVYFEVGVTALSDDCISPFSIFHSSNICLCVRYRVSLRTTGICLENFICTFTRLVQQPCSTGVKPNELMTQDQALLLRLKC